MENVSLAEKMRKVAEEYARAGRYDDAIVLYQELVEQHPEEDSFMLALAWACHDGKRIEEAVAWFEKLFDKELARHVFTGFAFDELVRIFKHQGQYDRLLGICERALVAHPGDFSLLGDLGEAYLRTGRAKQAAVVFRQMTEMEPEAATAFCRLGNALIAMGDFAGVEAAYARAVAIDPEEEGSYYGRLAEEYRKVGDGERAAAAIRRSLAKEASEPAYYLILGDILIEADNADEGWRAYVSAIQLRPAFAGVYSFRLGNTLMGAATYEKAALAFQQAIAAEPENSFYFLRLAEANAAMGREDLAREALRQAESLAKRP